jgi:hypothetical protein
MGVLATIYFTAKVPETKNRSLEQIEQEITGSSEPHRAAA